MRAILEHLDGTRETREDCAGGNEWHFQNGERRYRFELTNIYGVPVYVEQPTGLHPLDVAARAAQATGMTKLSEARCEYRGEFSDGSDRCGHEAGHTGPHFSSPDKYPKVSDWSRKPVGIDSPIALEAMIRANENVPRNSVYVLSHDFNETLAKIQATPSDPLFANRPSVGSARERRPVQGVRAAKAPEDESYRICWGDDFDTVYLMTSDRILTLSGKVLRLYGQSTNAPSGERALLDDDLESILQHHDRDTRRIVPHVADEYHELKKSLFVTDPDVVAFVASKIDMPVKDEVFVSERFLAAMELAWERSGAGGNGAQGHEPERGWQVRAAQRASRIVSARHR